MWSTRTPLTITVGLVLALGVGLLSSAFNFGWWELTTAGTAALVLTTLTDRDAFYRGTIHKPDPQRRRHTPRNILTLRATVGALLASWHSRR